MKLLFMGRKAEAAEALAWTLEQGHEVVGVLTDSHLPGSITAALAESRGLPLMTYDQAANAVAAGRLAFDLGVSFVYWRILKAPLLGHPPLGIVNFHPAPLPAYKGTGGYNLAVLDALPSWEVTAHYVDAGIDTGGIIDHIAFDLDPATETAQTVERTSMGALLDLYKRTVVRIDAEGVLPTSPNVGGRYVTRAEMEAMKQVLPGDDVERKARAFWFPPYRGAYVLVDGVPCTLLPDSLLETLAPEGATSLYTGRS